MRRLTLLLLLICLSAGLAVPVAAQVARSDSAGADSVLADTMGWTPGPKKFGRTALEVVAINTLVWSYNRYIREGGTNPGFRISLDSWKNNIQNGFEWDDNHFNTNQFAHPYHGSLYFNAARTSGYDFWESIPFAFAGSFMWEYFGEVHNPSMNDWVATSVGGVGLGESLNRLSMLAVDNTKTGAGRNWQELGAAVLNPVGFLNRILDGKAFKKGPNPPEHDPVSLAARFEFGLRTTGEDRIWQADTTRAYAAFEWDYGDPYLELNNPFDAFSFYLQLYFSERSVIGLMAADGSLWGTSFHETETTNSLFLVNQHYDYFNTNAFQFGGQSLGTGIQTRFKINDEFSVDTRILANWLIMGGVSSSYEAFTGREYDYGTGVGSRFRVVLMRNGRPLFSASDTRFLIYTLNGPESDHSPSFTRLRADFPMGDFLGVGLEYILIALDSRYDNFEDTYRRQPEFRGSLTWALH